MGAQFTITAYWWQYGLACLVVAALIACAFWVGRLDRRDGRVFVGIRETNARFDQLRAMRERSRRRVEEALAALQAVSLPVVTPQRPRWAPAVEVIDVDPAPVPDEERPVEPGDDEYPPGLRAEFGAMRLPVELRGDEQQAVWAVGRKPASHRAEPDVGEHRTLNLAAAVGRAAPPGVAA